jgi:hypothetical protein
MHGNLQKCIEQREIVEMIIIRMQGLHELFNPFVDRDNPTRATSTFYGGELLRPSIQYIFAMFASIALVSHHP